MTPELSEELLERTGDAIGAAAAEVQGRRAGSHR
jgi:hypothetical protein